MGAGHGLSGWLGCDGVAAALRGTAVRERTKHPTVCCVSALWPINRYNLITKSINKESDGVLCFRPVASRSAVALTPAGGGGGGGPVPYGGGVVPFAQRSHLPAVAASEAEATRSTRARASPAASSSSAWRERVDTRSALRDSVA